MVTESQLEGKVYNQEFLAKINKTKQNTAPNGFIATCHLLYDSLKTSFQTSKQPLPLEGLYF